MSGMMPTKPFEMEFVAHLGQIEVVHNGEIGLVSLGVKKLQLGECLDKMSSEIATLKDTIVSKDKQKENLQRALEDGAALEKSMLDEIKLQHCRAQELEIEIERLQRENADANDGDVDGPLEIQNLTRVLHEHNAQLVVKTRQINSYEQVLRNTAERLEGVPVESQQTLVSAFEIAGSLRKLLEESDKQFANLGRTCQSREMELAEVQRQLELTNFTLNKTVGSRDARIRELENMLGGMESEVQDTQQQLLNVEQKIDANESRARKLELNLKVMSNLL